MRRLTLAAALIGLTASAAERPRLGVLVIVDQLSADAFHARAASTKGGFRRLLSDGLWIHELRYEAAPTITSIGHATLATGTYAETHGIAANEWIDAETGAARLSTEDPAFTIVGRPPGPRDGTAPTALRAGTLTESLRAAFESSKILVVSAKDRSAILSAGRTADAVLWLDSTQPLFVTSTFYAQALPAFVTPINVALAEAVQKQAFAWGLPAGGITGKSPPSPPPPPKSTFPERAETQPLIDKTEIDLALAGAKALSLGADEVPDLLVVCLSSHDRMGHLYGPDAPEALAHFALLDAQLGRLFDGLDAQVGKGRYVALLTSDHGVAPLPELMKARHLDAGHVDAGALVKALKKEADAALGPAEWFLPYKTPGLTATPALRAKLHTIDERLRAVAQKQPGVLDLLSQEELLRPGAYGTLGDLYRKGLVPGRSPDFIVVTRPYWTTEGAGRSGHASSYLYDRAVPLLVMGPGIAKGELWYADALDVAPTLARLLGAPPPAAARGHSIPEVFR